MVQNIFLLIINIFYINNKLLYGNQSIVNYNETGTFLLDISPNYFRQS